MFGDIENVTITEDEVILVDDWDYLLKAVGLYYDLAKNKKRDFENLLMWLFVKDIVGFLPQRFQNTKLEFDRVN